MHRTTIATLAATAVLALSLTACGTPDGPVGSTAGTPAGSPVASSGSDPIALPEAMYTFDDLLTGDNHFGALAPAGQPLGIALSADLAALAPDLAVDSFVVETKAFPTGVCRTDIAINWAEGGLAAVKARGDVSKQLLVDVAETVAVLPTDSELDGTGTWLRADSGAATNVDDCGIRPVTLRLPILEPLFDAYFAEVEVTSLEDGSTAATDGKVVEKYTKVSVTGTWTREDPPVPDPGIDGTWIEMHDFKKRWFENHKLVIKGGRVHATDNNGCDGFRTPELDAVFDGKQLIMRHHAELAATQAVKREGNKLTVIHDPAFTQVFWAEGSPEAKQILADVEKRCS